MKAKIKKPMISRLNKRQRKGGDELYCSNVNDGIDFTPKPEEIEGILKYMDALEAKEVNPTQGVYSEGK